MWLADIRVECLYIYHVYQLDNKFGVLFHLYNIIRIQKIGIFFSLMGTRNKHVRIRDVSISFISTPCGLVMPYGVRKLDQYWNNVGLLWTSWPGIYSRVMFTGKLKNSISQVVIDVYTIEIAVKSSRGNELNTPGANISNIV